MEWLRVDLIVRRLFEWHSELTAVYDVRAERGLSGIDPGVLHCRRVGLGS